MRRTPEVTLPLTLDRADATPLPDQIAAGLRALVADGVLLAGDPLPSTRSLAQHLGVSRGSVVVAYDQLLAEGWLEARSGRGTRVHPNVRAVRPREPQPAPSRPRPAAATSVIDLRPGRPAEGALVDATWRSAWRRAADEPLDVPVPMLGWGPLREAIAEHLRRMRAVVRPAGHIAVTAGGRDGLALLLAATGVRRVGVEDPGYPSLRRVLDRAGVEIVALPTDTQGLMPERLPGRPPELVIVTPSHQYPLGGSLPVARRQALLEWANRAGVWIVEDDYDSELRYTSAPLPALAAMDPHRVILLGTFSKTLTPALATGFLVLPEALVGQVAVARADMGTPVSLVTQRAVGHYLDAGGLLRHTQRMRHLYRRRRTEVVEALGGLPGVSVQPMDGGLHAVVRCAEPEHALLARLRAGGVEVAGLSEYWSGAPGVQSGIVFGFAAVPDPDLRAGLRIIAETLV